MKPNLFPKRIKPNFMMVNFRADQATLDAIDELVASYVPKAGDLRGKSKSRAIRAAILSAAARIGKPD